MNQQTLTHKWSPMRRGIVSVLVALHILAVFSAPWSEPPPSSALARRVSGWFRPYQKLIAIDNGYRFFAPDPGPSHLIRFEVYDKEDKVADDVFPDRNRHRPRLLYHRYFMVSEMVASLVGPLREIPPNAALTEVERAEIGRRQRVVDELQRGIARRILSEHPQASRIRLFSVRHEIPSPMDVGSGMSLTSPSLYREILLGDFTAEQLRKTKSEEAPSERIRGEKLGDAA